MEEIKVTMFITPWVSKPRRLRIKFLSLFVDFYLLEVKFSTLAANCSANFGF